MKLRQNLRAFFCIGLFFITSFVVMAYDFKIDGIYYTITSSTAPHKVEIANSDGTFSWNYSGNITIPSTITSNQITYTVNSIGTYAFYNCTGLTSVTIPSSVISIGNSAFDSCTGLTSINIPTSVTSIGISAFYNCTKLSSVTIPSSVTSIGNFTFSSCTGLTSVNIPSSITSIGSSAFSNCSKLNSVTIPSSVTSIGDNAFEFCTGLTSIYVNSPTPINLSSSFDVFFYVNNISCTLFVPTGSKSLYEVAEQWKDFINIVVFTPTADKNISENTLQTNVINGQLIIKQIPYSPKISIYNTQGVNVYTKQMVDDNLTLNLPANGMYVLKVGSLTKKIVY